MAVISAQVAQSTAAAQVFPSATFPHQIGNMQDSIPAIIKNLDAAITVYIGPVGVTSSTGYPLLPGQSLPFSFITTEMGTVYCVAASGTPTLAILVGRQS